MWQLQRHDYTWNGERVWTSTSCLLTKAQSDRIIKLVSKHENFAGVTYRIVEEEL